MSDEVLIKPLYLFERDSIEFKKEVEEDIKTYSKLDLKSFNKDKDAYKQGLDEAISTYVKNNVLFYFKILLPIKLFTN